VTHCQVCSARAAPRMGISAASLLAEVLPSQVQAPQARTSKGCAGALCNGAGPPPPGWRFLAVEAHCSDGFHWPWALARLDKVRTPAFMSAAPLPDAAGARARTCTAAVSACGQGTQWERALVLLEESASQRLVPSVVRHSAAISACEKGLQAGFALRLLAEMPRLQIAPSVISYNAAISALEKRGRWVQALDLLERMWWEGRARPDAVSFSAVVSACGRSGQWESGVALLADMVGLRVVPNVITYSALISACDKGGAWARALLLLSDMHASRVQPNFVSLHAAISACLPKGRWRSALQLLTVMRQCGVRVNVVGCSAAIQACESAMATVHAAHLLGTLGRTARRASHCGDTGGGGNGSGRVNRAEHRFHAVVAMSELHARGMGTGRVTHSCLAWAAVAVLRRSYAPMVSIFRALLRKNPTRHGVVACWAQRAALLRSAPLRGTVGTRDTLVRGVCGELLPCDGVDVHHPTRLSWRAAAQVAVHNVLLTEVCGTVADDLSASPPGKWLTVGIAYSVGGNAQVPWSVCCVGEVQRRFFDVSARPGPEVQAGGPEAGCGGHRRLRTGAPKAPNIRR